MDLVCVTSPKLQLRLGHAPSRLVKTRDIHVTPAPRPTPDLPPPASPPRREARANHRRGFPTPARPHIALPAFAPIGASPPRHHPQTHPIPFLILGLDTRSGFSPHRCRCWPPDAFSDLARSDPIRKAPQSHPAKIRPRKRRFPDALDLSSRRGGRQGFYGAATVRRSWSGDLENTGRS